MRRRRSLPHSRSRPEPWQDIALALARQIGSDRSAADAALKTLIEKDADDAALPDRRGLRAAQRCEGDLRVARSGLEQPRSGYPGLLYDPFILRYKDDPRFAAFCRKVGLPVPGETSAHKSGCPLFAI